MITRSAAISVRRGMFRSFVPLVFRLDTRGKFDPPPLFLLLFYLFVYVLGALAFFIVPSPLLELKNLNSLMSN